MPQLGCACRLDVLAPRHNCRCVRSPRHDPRHAQAAGRNRFVMNPNFPDGFLAIATSAVIEIGQLSAYPLLLLHTDFMVRRTFDAACRLAGLTPNIRLDSRVPHTSWRGDHTIPVAGPSVRFEDRTHHLPSNHRAGIRNPYMSGGCQDTFCTPRSSSRSFCSTSSAHLFVPTLAPIKHGAQDRSRTALWRRPKGLSLNDRAPCYARTIMRVRGSPGACVVLGAFVVSRSSVEVHGSCEDRITLYPAAPLWLATLLHAWTIARVGWCSASQRQTGETKICDGFRQQHIRPAQRHPKERWNC